MAPSRNAFSRAVFFLALVASGFGVAAREASPLTAGPLRRSWQPLVRSRHALTAVKSAARDVQAAVRPSTEQLITRIKGGAKQASAFTTLPPIILAAATTGALMYPIDLLRALKMTSVASGAGNVGIGKLVAEFRAAHGLKGFLTQGLGPELTKSTLSRSLKFFCYPVAHRFITGGKSPSEGTMMTKACAGVIATIPETLMILPLEVAKLALQLDKQGVYSNSARAVMGHLLTQRGPSALFIGLIAVQLRQAAWTATYFATVSSCTDACTKGLTKIGMSEDSPATSSLASFLGGYGAGVLGVCVNNPPDVVRSVVQKNVLGSIVGQSGDKFPGGLAGIWTATSDIVSRRGVGGLYAGFTFKSMHLGGSGALMNFLLPLYKKMLRV